MFVYYCTLEAFTAGNSQPLGPKCGMTIISPSLFLTGLEKVHKDLPRVDSQAELMVVTPNPKNLSWQKERRSPRPTLDEDSGRAHDFKVDDEIRRRRPYEDRGGMNEYIFRDT